MKTVLKAGVAAAALLLGSGLNASSALASSTLHVLFVGDSFTHGRYDPVREFNSGYDTGAGSVAAPHVHDLLCPSAATCSAAESVAIDDPDTAAYPQGDTTLAGKLAYLLANPSLQYAEHGPFGGIPGIVLGFSRTLHVRMDISILAVSASTLGGKNIGGNPANLALIANPTFDRVVLQDQSNQPLPTTVVVNGVTITTKGVPAAFAAGVSLLVNAIDVSDAQAGRAPIPVTLFETPAIASEGFVSSDPADYLYGTSYGPAGSPSAPYVGAADPMGQMTGDLRQAYETVAANWNAANPTASRLDVAHVGDAWLEAMHLGVAQTNPYLPTEPKPAVDLWDSDVLDACCVVPIGYHPSSAGAYLDALVLFGTLTNRSPLDLGPFDPTARALGLTPRIAAALQVAAAWTLRFEQGQPSYK